LDRAAHEPIVITTSTGRSSIAPAGYENLAADVQAINTWLQTVPLTLAGGGSQAWLHRSDYSPLWKVVTTQHVQLHRTFTGSIERGGRLYGGFWIQQSAQWRFQHMRLAGEPIASCDFREVQLRLAYRRLGIAWPFAEGECGYTAGDGGRHGWKSITNAMLAAPRPLRNWPGDAEERAAIRAQFPKSSRLPDVVGAIHRRHARLSAAGAFGTGLSGLLTRMESDVMVAILMACRARELAACPVHDCLLAPASRAAEGMAIMREVAMEVAGAELPVSIESAERTDAAGK
jgi:hypothetical protein